MRKAPHSSTRRICPPSMQNSGLGCLAILLGLAMTAPFSAYGTPPTPTYHLKVQAVICSDDDGQYIAGAVPANIATWLTEANIIYATAGLDLVFDPIQDVIWVNSTLLNRDYTVSVDLTQYTDPSSPPPTSVLDSTPNSQARTALANSPDYRNKLVLFFRRTEHRNFVFDQGLGHWVVDGSRGSSSGWGGNHVNLHQGIFVGGKSIAHEAGHYLFNRHPFVGNLNTKEQVETAINQYLETRPASEALNRLDGDRHFVRDTPPDAAGSIYASLDPPRNKCDPDPAGEVWLDVFKVYPRYVDYFQVLLNPDRRNFMSYYGCSWDSHFSPDQAERSRDALENFTRHRLVSPQLAPSSGPLRLQGTAVEGLGADVKLVRTRRQQVVAAYLTNSGKLRLAAYQADDSGNLTRQGQIETSEDANEVEALSMGLGYVVTAIRTADGKFQLTVWDVDAAGNFTRWDTYTHTLHVIEFAMARVGPEYLMTAVRRNSGELVVQGWEISVNGWFLRHVEKSIGYGDQLSMAAIGHGMRVMTAHRASGTILTTWEMKTVDNQWQIHELDQQVSRTTQAVSVRELDTDRVVEMSAAPTGEQLLTVWRVDDQGLLTQAGTQTGYPIVSQAGARLGVDLFGTIVNRQTAVPIAEVRVWQVSPDGQTVQSALSDSWLLSASELAATQIDRGKLAVAAVDLLGNINLAVWSIDGLILP